MQHALHGQEVFLEGLESPAYVLSEESLERNAKTLAAVAEHSGAKIVLAQKAFAQPQLYSLLGKYLAGACASGPWEAQLAREYFQKEAHVLTCAPAYSEADIEVLLPISNHLDFNSIEQWLRFKEGCLEFQKNHPDQDLQFGLRVNPEYSTGENTLYDPCVAGSRLGATIEQIENAGEIALEGLSGLHFHTLCEQNSDDLEATVAALEEKYGEILKRPEITYLNLGGGHWITKPFYDQEKLIRIVKHLRETYDLEIWLEPGEAVVIHSGVLLASVFDIVKNGEVTNVILDVSATAHMPDVLEMPYRPDVFTLKGEKATESGNYLYRLGGCTCLASDVVGDYAFNQSLEVGDKLIFDDMAHYTMVKSTFFNGVQHPSIQLLTKSREVQCLREFSFEDYLRLKK